MKTVLIVAMRIGSSRLPTKMLLPLINKPVARYFMLRTNFIKKVDTVVIAMPDTKENDTLAAWLPEWEIYRYHHNEYDEENQMDRFNMAVQEEDPDLIVRVTPDCPLFPPVLVDAMINFMQLYENKDYDFVTTMILKSERLEMFGYKNYCGFDPQYGEAYTLWPWGCTAEVFTRDAFERARRMADRDEDLKLAPTKALYVSNHEFKTKWDIDPPEPMPIRLCLDTWQDYEEICNVAKQLNIDFSYKEMIEAWKKLRR